MRGDCSIRVDGIGFTADEVAACAQRLGLLSIEIELEPGPACRCDACTPGGAARPILTVDEILGLLDQAVALGCRRCILVDGERASHAQLPRLIAAARERALEVELFTAGHGIDAPAARRLADQRVTVALRLDALQGVPPGAKAALADLRRAGYAQAAGPVLALRTVVTETNLPGYFDLWRWARHQGIRPWPQVMTPAAGQGSSAGGADMVSPHRIRALFEELARIDSEEFGRRWPTPPELTGRACNRHQFACHVTSCGLVFACVGITIPLGDTREQPLRIIVDESEVLENLRAFKRKLKEPCLTCSQTAACYGCRGSAYQLTGDYMAGDAQCWKAIGVDIPVLPLPAADKVPHGPSMRVLDRLVTVGERYARTDYVVPREGVLVDAHGRLDEMAYVEMLAQSFAAAHGLHLGTDGGTIHGGLLLGVKNLAVTGEARAGDHLTIDIREITRFGDFGVIEGTVHNQRGQLVARGEVKIWRPSTDPS